MWQNSHVGWIEAATAHTGVAPKGSSLEDLTSSQLVFAECEVMDTTFQSPRHFHIKGRFLRPFKMPKSNCCCHSLEADKDMESTANSAEVMSVKRVT